MCGLNRGILTLLNHPSLPSVVCSNSMQNGSQMNRCMILADYEGTFSSGQETSSIIAQARGTYCILKRNVQLHMGTYCISKRNVQAKQGDILPSNWNVHAARDVHSVLGNVLLLLLLACTKELQGTYCLIAGTFCIIPTHIQQASWDIPA